VKLSPNGESIASIVQSTIENKTVSVLKILDIKTNQTKSLLHTDNKNLNLAGFAGPIIIKY